MAAGASEPAPGVWGVGPGAWRLAAVAAGLAADRLLGEPPARVHPVAAYGAAMSRIERRAYADRRSAGAAYATAGVGLAAALGHLAGRRRRPATAVATWVVVAGRGLALAARDVALSLQQGDLVGARLSLPALVGRDPDGLDAAEIARAVVESVAENTVDAIVAPAMWAAMCGPAGALGYRAVNTLDAMVGHRCPRYQRFGWASARLDDLAGWVPARLTAVFVAAVRPAAAGSVWATVRRDAPAHPSPNAGVAEAAFAAALGVGLGGTSSYGRAVEHRPHLGTGRPASPQDIERAVRLSRDVTAALVASLLVASLLVAASTGGAGLRCAGVLGAASTGGAGVLGAGLRGGSLR